MAVKPIISMITPFDATVGSNITFSYSGNLPVKVRGTVRNASTFEIVWSDEQTAVSDHAGRYLFYIQPDVLKTNPRDENGNGYKYCVQVCVIDNDSIASPYSDKAYFWCLEAPVFVYSSPPNESTISGSSVDLEITYYQPNGERLQSYRHYLYDNSKNLVNMSDTFYDETGFKYSFRGLDNKTSYYIRSEGMTKNGMHVDTGFTHFFTSYGDTWSYSILGLESDKNATVYGTTNIICIDADEDPDYYVFLDSRVQLYRKVVTYQTNYNVARDFKLKIKITKLLYSGIILRMHHKEYPDCEITLDSYVFDDGSLRYCLKANNGIATYVLYTDAMNVNQDDTMIITIKRVNNVFGLYAELVN